MQIDILSGGWVPWLEYKLHTASASLASDCMKTLLHLNAGWGHLNESTNCTPLMFHDGIHVFNPVAQYNWERARMRHEGDPYENSQNHRIEGI